MPPPKPSPTFSNAIPAVSGTRKLRNSETQKLRNSETQKLGNSETQKLGNSETRKLGNSQTQIRSDFVSTESWLALCCLYLS